MTTPRRGPNGPNPATPATPAVPALPAIGLDEVLRLEAEAQRLLDRAAQGRTRLNALTPAQRDAEALHDAICTLSHVDQCSWHYETWLSPGNTRHKEYLNRAKKIATDSGLTVDEAIRIYNIVRSR